MKRLMIILLLVGFGSSIKAQTFAEWFRQNATQRKYLIEQIAALKLYAGVLKKGYDIGKKGLTMIGDIKNGDFNLHKNYFGSLLLVNPEIKNYARVDDIISLLSKIAVLRDKTINKVNKNDLLGPGERLYCSKVFGRVMEDCEHAVDALNDVAADGSLNLKDDERLQRIDKIYIDISDTYSFAKAFSDEAIQIIIDRGQDKQEAENGKMLNGIK